MRGQLLELLFYPQMLAVLLLLFAFLSGEQVSELRATAGVLGQSDAALAASGMALLNCTPDHHLEACRGPTGGGGYGVRRLAVEGGVVKELIFRAPD